MSHQIVECPGCLTKLRVKESTSVLRISCPRCGEQLAVDPPETAATQRPTIPSAKSPSKTTHAAAAPKQQVAPVQPSKPVAPPRSTPSAAAQSSQRPQTTSRPRRSSSGSSRPATNDAEDWGMDDWGSNEDDAFQSPAPARRAQQTFLQKHGLLLGILGGAAAGLLILVVGGVVWWISRPDKVDSSTTVAQNAEMPPSNQTNSVVVPSEVSSNPNSSVAANSGIAQNQPPANDQTDSSGIGSPPAIASTATPTPVAPSPGATPFNGNGGTNNSVAAAQVPGNTRKLRYDWKPGAEFVYQFSIQEGDGDSYSKTTGVCSYKVEGSANASTDEEESSGTGFVISPDGVLATCAHVVEGTKRLEVNLAGKSYPATVIAVDARTDVALIKITATGLPALNLADSDSVQLAESVRAIGYPLSDVLGTDVKVTTGTVAGIIQDKQRGRRIQIDAAINPGNSGGPVVNGSGLVVGVASAKLSGSSVTAVGFAAPINDLRSLAATKGISLSVAAHSPELSGPEVARRITPSVAYIRAWGNSGGRLYNLTYTASFSESQQQTRRMGRGFAMPGPPSFPSHTSDRGKLTVNALGEVVEYQGKEQLPAVLGPVGLFFLEPLDAYSEAQWQTESETSLSRIKRDESRFGPFGGRRGFGPPGFPDPFGRDREDEVIETIPATEKTTYRVENSLNGRISIAKSYEFTATRSNGQPYMNIRGNGTVVFDTQRGVPSSLEFTSRVQQDNDGSKIDVPVKISYTLRSLEELQREKEQAELARKKQEEERTTPNPDLVDEILAQLKATEGGNGAIQPLTRLGLIAVVDSRRDEVIRVMKNHMSNSNAFVRKSATEVFCTYATKEHMVDLKKILEDRDGLMMEARKRAFRTVADVGTAVEYPMLIGMVTDSFLRTEARNVLIGLGPVIEEPILKELDSMTDSNAQNELLEVLKKVGTAKSISRLEQFAKSGSGSTKYTATQALDAIRARE